MNGFVAFLKFFNLLPYFEQSCTVTFWGTFKTKRLYLAVILESKKQYVSCNYHSTEKNRFHIKCIENNLWDHDFNGRCIMTYKKMVNMIGASNFFYNTPKLFKNS